MRKGRDSFPAMLAAADPNISTRTVRAQLPERIFFVYKKGRQADKTSLERDERKSSGPHIRGHCPHSRSGTHGHRFRGGFAFAAALGSITFFAERGFSRNASKVPIAARNLKLTGMHGVDRSVGEAGKDMSLRGMSVAGILTGSMGMKEKRL